MITSEVWEHLAELANSAAKKAYVPYSHYPVGAAAITTDGRYFSGCNVENAAYGVTLCAECSLISALIMDGGGQLAAFLCVNQHQQIIVPCGRCRQLLFEHGGKQLLLQMPQGIKTMDQVLPQGFGPDDLAAGSSPEPSCTPSTKPN